MNVKIDRYLLKIKAVFHIVQKNAVFGDFEASRSIFFAALSLFFYSLIISQVINVNRNRGSVKNNKTGSTQILRCS